MTDCINAEGVQGNEYGHVRTGRQWAHRAAWESAHGPISSGLVVRHTCDNPRCINLEHLLLGTVADNQRDMAERGRGRNQNTDKDSCRQGHPLDGSNLQLWIDKRGGKHRHCRACKNAAKREARLVGVS